MGQSEIFTDEAIILGERDWGQADKMLQFYTKEHGLVKGAAFGCRRARSQLAGGMQLFHKLVVTFSEGNQAEGIATVRQYVSLDRHYQVISDIERFAYGSFLAEIIVAISPERLPDEKIYQVIDKSFSALGTRNPQLVTLAAISQIFRLGGWGDIPIPAAENGAAEGLSLYLTLSHLDWQNPPTFSAKRSTISQVEKAILAFFHRQIGSRLKSYKFLQEMRQKP